jgi:hypothetical protein
MFGVRSAVLRILTAIAVLVIAVVVSAAGGVSLVMGAALGEEVVLGAIGGLVAGVLYLQIEDDRASLAVFYVLIGATALILLDCLLDAVVGLEA